MTIYFWWENIKGIPESSHKALRIMQLTTAMVVMLIAWCIYTVLVRHPRLPPAPWPSNIRLDRNSLGWLNGKDIVRMIPMIAIFVGLGHSVLAMSGEESLGPGISRDRASQAAEPEKGRLGYFHLQPGIHIAGFDFRGDDHSRRRPPEFPRKPHWRLGDEPGGPVPRCGLLFHIFVVVVGTLILAGAVNTAIVGSNGVLNRVSEDGVLPDWFRQPHRRFGTSYRIINIVVFFQIVTIVISRGDVTFLANLYAFGVIWSFAMKGLAVLVLRLHPAGKSRVPGPA